MVHHRVEVLDPVFVALSRLGTYGFVWIALAILAVLMWRRPYVLPLVVVAVVASNLVTTMLKRATERPRPSVTYPEPDPLTTTPLDLSFPSGHASTGFAAATVISAYDRRAAAPLFVFAAAIAWSRVYVGVHYPLDIFAGAAVGFVLATALLRLAAALRRSPQPRRGG